MTIFYESRSYREDGWQFWLVEGPENKWVKIAGARKNSDGQEIYEKYSRHEGIGYVDPSKEVSKAEFIEWFQEMFDEHPFELTPTQNSGIPRAPINQVGAEFYTQFPMNELWDCPLGLYAYINRKYTSPK